VRDGAEELERVTLLLQRIVLAAAPRTLTCPPMRTDAHKQCQKAAARQGQGKVVCEEGGTTRRDADLQSPTSCTCEALSSYFWPFAGLSTMVPLTATAAPVAHAPIARTACRPSATADGSESKLCAVCWVQQRAHVRKQGPVGRPA